MCSPLHETSPNGMRAEAALRESEANLNRAQRSRHIGSWYLDVIRNRLTWSDEVFRIFGVPKGTASDLRGVPRTVHPEDRDAVARRGLPPCTGRLMTSSTASLLVAR